MFITVHNFGFVLIDDEVWRYTGFFIPFIGVIIRKCVGKDSVMKLRGKSIERERLSDVNAVRLRGKGWGVLTPVKFAVGFRTTPAVHEGTGASHVCPSFGPSRGRPLKDHPGSASFGFLAASRVLAGEGSAAGFAMLCMLVDIDCP